MLRVTRLAPERSAYYLDDLASEIDAVLVVGTGGGPAGRPGPAGDAGHSGDAGHPGDAGRVAGRPAPGMTAPGWWVGAGAQRLGLSGAVGADHLSHVLAGCGPNGRPLARGRHGVAGYDLTFTAPKSVSVLFALGGAEVASEILRSHHESVRAAVGYLERRALTVRRRAGEDRELLGTDGVIGATFTHAASRALDPHLHSHVVVANLAHGEDGRWTAVDGRGLYAHRAAAGALYRAQLRHELSTTLSVEWERPGTTGAEMKGIDPVLLGDLSKRAAEIRAHLWATGRSSPAAARVAWAATRQPKAPEDVRATLAQRWLEGARWLGVDRDDLSRVVGRRLPDVTGLDEHRFAAALWLSPHATAARRDVVQAWAGSLERGAPVAEVEGAVDAWVPASVGAGVGESRHALSGLIPAGYLVRALGPRPLSAAAQNVWQEGAQEVIRYRRRWGVTDRDNALGIDDSNSARAGLELRRLADHVAVTRTLSGVARQLGREHDPLVRSGFGREVGVAGP